LQLGASSVWSALPSEPKLTLSNEHLRIALCRLLCIDTRSAPDDADACPNCKATPLTSCARKRELAWDDHIANCTGDGFLATRHNQLQNTLRQEALALGQPSKLAPVLRPSSDAGPAIIADLVFPCIPGRNGAWGKVIDISVASVICVAVPPNMAHIPLAAARQRERDKNDKELAPAQALNLDFSPVVWESTGALGQSAKDFLHTLLANSCTLPDNPAAQSSYTRLTQALAISLHRSTGDKFIAAKVAHYGPGDQPVRRLRGQAARRL